MTIQPGNGQSPNRAGKVLPQPVAYVVVLDAFDTQAHARQRGAQVMRHRSQEARLLRKLRANALLHQVQRTCGIACFGGPGLFLQRRRVDVLRKAVRAAGQLLHRPRQQAGPNP